SPTPPCRPSPSARRSPTPSWPRSPASARSSSAGTAPPSSPCAGARHCPPTRAWLTDGAKTRPRKWVCHMNAELKELLDLLDLEQIEVNIFRGRSPEERQQRVFGGQVAGQALVAAGRTVPVERHVHSLHAYFIRPGDPPVPLVYEVDRVRDGRSFTTRRVSAIQHGKVIFTLSASFQVREDGPTHQAPMPEVPGPEELPTFGERLGALFGPGAAGYM